MQRVIRIGTRESQLAVWQATRVKELLAPHGFTSELVFIKSEGDIDLETPLYEMGVEGIFTKSLDIALLNDKIDVAVHSMKDVPTQLAQGLVQCGVLKRGPVEDLLVFRKNGDFLNKENHQAHIATSSIRRKAQWLNRFPSHTIHNLRGNLNTRLQKLSEKNWDAAIFAQAGLERIKLRPVNSVVIDWMLPAPAQGAIMMVCRKDDSFSFAACGNLNDVNTAFCTKIERDFLRALLGGCSTPISALAIKRNGELYFKGNMLSLDGSAKAEIEKIVKTNSAEDLGKIAAEELLNKGGKQIADSIRNAGK
jgi:hydroxymethylbilane synthase